MMIRCSLDIELFIGINPFSASSFGFGLDYCPRANSAQVTLCCCIDCLQYWRRSLRGTWRMFPTLLYKRASRESQGVMA